MSEPDPPALSEAQLEIMQLVWDRGEVTVAEVWKALGERRKVARNTVQTLMARLEEKGWLEVVEEGHAFRYKAAVARKATLGTMVKKLVETAFNGSAEGLVHALLDGRGVSPDEAERIRALIDQAEAKSRPKGKGDRT